MPPNAQDRWLEVEQVGGITVARITRPLADDTEVKRLGEHLRILLQQAECPNLVLNLAAVARYTSLLLAQFVALHQKARAGGGRLLLCQVPPDLYEALHRTRLTQLFHLCADEREALRVLAPPR